MFDAAGAFKRQFTPVEGGYLYYPSNKRGGKLVTAKEYEALAADWQSVFGSRGGWKAFGLLVGFILVWTLASQALHLPDWTEWIMIGISVVAISARLLWVAFAPFPLVRGRPDVAPPQPMKEAGREARAMLKWPLVTFVLLFSGTAFFGLLSSPEPTLSWWAWLIGSGVFFGSYLWIGFQKVMDRRR